jgi:hypothetical protein
MGKFLVKLEKCIGSEHAMATMQTGELAHYSVQSDDAIAVYKAFKQSPNSAFAGQKIRLSLDDSNHKISYRNCLFAVLVYIIFSVL